MAENSDYATFPAWSKTVDECLSNYGVSSSEGLSNEIVIERREKFGWNELEKEPGKPMWKLVLEQFDDTLVKILLGAAVVSFILAFVDGSENGESGITAYIEPLVILSILILNAIVGVWQESNAEKALEALKEMQSESAKVIRNGKFISDLPARELVPGDIVELRVGDKAPADMRVIELKTSTMRVEQSSLTGESMAVIKTNLAVSALSCELQAKQSMIFAGTTVVNGSSLNIVTLTGMRTEIGKIQAQITAASQEEESTPLKKKLDEFGDRLTAVIAAVCLLVWLINYRHFLDLQFAEVGENSSVLAKYLPSSVSFSFERCTYYFKIAVALAVAAIPEGLPAVITTCLALGTRKMAQKNAIVRKLPSVETLGCTTVICSDKTGTLTTNQMSATAFVALGSSPLALKRYSVNGTTYSPLEGEILGWREGSLEASRNLQSFAEVAVCCNESSVELKNDSFHATGLPTEAALKVLVEKMGVPDRSAMAEISLRKMADLSGNVLACCDWWSRQSRRVAVLEFDRIRKSMGVIVRKGAENTLLVKGAVENVLSRSAFVQLEDGSVEPMSAEARRQLSASAGELSSKALRCLALAYSSSSALSQHGLAGYDGPSHAAHAVLLDPARYSDIEKDLVFVGIVALRDPPRLEVPSAIRACQLAGIRVIVITGDNKNTAEAICKEIGVLETSQNSFSGTEFAAMDPADRLQVLSSPGGIVVSRAEPGHKQEIVRSLRAMGHVVAMTGDGVNDAPALKLADIGIAMGIAGTEVAKEASDMVLADDNFSTIVAAVEEGRSIYNNMKAFIRYMISSNIGEVASIFLTAALGLPEGLIPVQLLWVNLVTDGPPATALGFNPPDKDIMRKVPRKSTDPLITAWVMFRYLVIGSYVGLATVGIFVVWYTQSSFAGIDLSQDGHSLVTYSQLANWGSCASWQGFQVAPFTAGAQTFSFDSAPCEYFSRGKVKAATLSLSVLVAIEMFNSLNALSEDGSLLAMPPWCNPWLLLAMAVSFGLHFLILYVPVLANIFGIVPLSWNEWLLVLVVSLPVILIDEVLKCIGRALSEAEFRRRKLKVE